MTVQIEIDENRLKRIDALSKEFQETRLDFLNRAVDEAIIKADQRLETIEKEKKAYEAYKKHPILPDEFEVEEEQLVEVWKDL